MPPPDEALKAGDLNRRVTLEAQADAADATLDANAEPEDLWGPVAEVWASVRPLKGQELYLARQTVAEADHEVRIRWSPRVAAINGRMRFTYQGQRYNIVAPPQEIGFRWGWLCLCKREEST